MPPVIVYIIESKTDISESAGLIIVRKRQKKYEKVISP